MPRASALPRLELLDDGPRVDGIPVTRVQRTHSAELWTTAELVVKRKLAVDLGFLDFTTLERRRRAIDEELTLNSRIAPDVYLGTTDVVDGGGEVVDVALVMHRMPARRRLSTLAAAGADLRDDVRLLARSVAAFHAAQEPAPDASRHASRDAVATNWRDNLDVVRAHPERVASALVDDVATRATAWLDGRQQLFRSRIESGWVRDGHGDLRAEDVFLLDDGPRVLDCLDFARRYRVGDVLLDVAFLAMELEMLARPDLAGALLADHAEFLGEHHPTSLAHHYVAYRASVRAKVACLADGPEDPAALLTLARDHLVAAGSTLVLVGGLPGTGKSTLAEELSQRLGLVLLRSDEVRKDLVGVGHQVPAGSDAYDASTTAATYDSLLRRADLLLRQGESVVLDATWAAPHHRQAAAAVAVAASARLVPLQCELVPSIAHARLRRRHGDASDADARVHDRMRAGWSPWRDAHRLDTSAPRGVVADAAVAAVHTSRAGAVAVASEN